MSWQCFSVLYEGVSKIFRTGAAFYTAVVVARSTVDGRNSMSSESVCQVARSWVDVGSFHTRLVVRFMIFTASVRNILNTPIYAWYQGLGLRQILVFDSETLNILPWIFVLFTICLFIIFWSVQIH
jgi:hypothetical protein